jgi:LCP family protein required for cell wall assembly
MSSAPSPALAAVLSFVFPGLGQIYAGEVRRGLVWSIPMLLFVVGVIWLLAGGQFALLSLIADAETRLALLVLNIGFFAYHLAAMFDAYSVAKRERVLAGAGSGGAPVALTALVILTLLLHGVPEAVGVTVPLLVGSDSRDDEGTGNNSLRTDTMILLSIETATCKAAMFGFPRNMVNAPLPPESAAAYPNGRFPDLLFGLWRRAAEQPQSFPGSEGIDGATCSRSFDCIRGWRALTGTVQQMAGVQVDGVIAVNLHGFEALVDAVGGVWLDIPVAVHEDRYRTASGKIIEPLDIPKGCGFFNGELALAYARSREQDSDYQRMRRQQYVIAQVRKQFDPLALLPRAPELIAAANQNLFMTIGEADLPHLAQLASGVDADRLYQVRFVRQRMNTDADIASMRQQVRDIFGRPEPRPTPTPRGGGERCPAPGQTP